MSKRSIPAMPDSLSRLVADNQWSSKDQDCVGWHPPQRLNASLAPILRRQISEAEALSKPVGNGPRLTLGLAQLSKLFPRQAGDGGDTWDVRYSTYAASLGRFPEDLVYDVLNDAAEKFKWWPSLKELLDLVEPRMALRNELLGRMRRLLEIAEAPPALPKPPPGKRWDQMTEGERVAFDAKLVELRKPLDVAAPKPAERKPARRYVMFDPKWVRSMRDCWLHGYRARSLGQTGTDCPVPDKTNRFFWVEGNLVAAGVACGEVVLTDQQLEQIDAALIEIESTLADLTHDEPPPAA